MAKKPVAQPTLTEILRQLLKDRDESHYRMSKETGVSQPVITRFMNGDRGISLATAEKLAAYLGITFTQSARLP